MTSGKEARCLADSPKRSGVVDRLHCAALSSDGSLLAVTTYSSAEEFENQIKVTLWDLAAGRPQGTLSGFRDCHALAFSPDGQWLAIGDMEYGGGKALGKIRLWRTSEIE